MNDDAPDRRLWTGVLFLVLSVAAVVGEVAAVVGGIDWLRLARGAALIGLFVLETVVRLRPLRETDRVNVLRVVFIGTWLALLVVALV